jgi:hypothetical protein
LAKCDKGQECLKVTDPESSLVRDSCFVCGCMARVSKPFVPDEDRRLGILDDVADL